MKSLRTIEVPLNEKEIKSLRSGEAVLLSGIVYTARDAAHKKIIELIKKKKKLPFEMKDQVIYYAAPAPAPPGKIIGPIGPTSSYRMDPFTATLFSQGLRGMIGKGPRSPETADMIRKHRAVYFTATGGAAAYLSMFVTEAETVCFPELGPEAVMRLKINGLPVIVAIDSYGNSIFKKRVKT